MQAGLPGLHGKIALHYRYSIARRHLMKFNRWLFTLLLSVCLSLSAALPARAQNSTTLSVTPAASEVLVNNNTTIRLYVTGGVEINAFDVAVTYNSQKLTLESWTYGNYLSGLARVYLVNQPGKLRGSHAACQAGGFRRGDAAHF